MALRGSPVPAVLEPGRLIRVLYTDEPNLWHERILLRQTVAARMKSVTDVVAETGENVWWIMTPDGDIYPEEIDVGPLKAVVLCNDQGEPDLTTMKGTGGRLRRTYGFDAAKAAGRPSSLTLGRALVAVDREESFGSTGSSGVAELQCQAGPSPTAPAGSEWRIISSTDDSKKGALDADTGRGWASMGPYLLVSTDAGHLVCQQRVLGSDEAVIVDPEAAGDRGDDDVLDARVLSVCRTPDGERHRPFREAVTLLAESQWDKWPITGPRTTRWCCRFIVEHDGNPRARHVRWKHSAGLSSQDPGVSDHESAMRVLEYAVTYDQVQACELACIEIILRRAQLVELKYRDRVVSLDPKGGVEDDEHLYLGTGTTRGLLMVCPLLEEFVASELHRETAAAKERRKMREERGLQRPPPPKK